MHASPSSLPTHHRTPSQRDGERPFSIVTFYEEFSDAARALLNSERITHAFSGRRPVRSTSWSFSLLGKPELNSLILQDASHADVLVVASSGDDELPERVASWVTLCIAADQAEKPVLLALHDENLEADGAAAPLCKMLKGIASQTHATFMCNHDIAIAAEAVPAPSIPEPAQVAAAGNVRRWGIND